jgi:hypothetical protein
MLSAIEIQEIFRHRHIVVMGGGNISDEVKFDRDGLRMLGSLTTPRQIHGVYFPLKQCTDGVTCTSISQA